MDDLIAFLRARLEEDERYARAVDDRSAPFDGEWTYVGGPEYGGDVELQTRNGWSLAVLPTGGPFRPGLLPHIARLDPARVLADVAAKRAIVELHQITPREAFGRAEYTCRECDWTPEEHLWNVGPACPTIRLLALPYADHPDYREEWRP